MERRKPGSVRDAIFETFKESKKSMTVSEVVTAVEARLGGNVASSSVRSYLNLNVSTGLFERVGHGTYKLRRTTR